MSLFRPHSVRVNMALGALLLGAVTLLPACEEEGKTAPATCATPPLAIYDIQTGGARDGDDKNPCTTDVGHAISSIGTTTTAGTATGGTATAGSSSGGKAGSGGTATAEAGAAGAAGAGGAP